MKEVKLGGQLLLLLVRGNVGSNFYDFGCWGMGIGSIMIQIEIGQKFIGLGMGILEFGDFWVGDGG